MIRKPGDWNCSSCEYLNFRRRDSCNSCGDLKSIGSDRFTNFNGGRRGSSFVRSGSDVRPGDWYCQCSAHNFAGRSNCIKCGAFKEGLLLGQDAMSIILQAGWNASVAAPRESGAEVGGNDCRDDIIEMTTERKEIT